MKWVRNAWVIGRLILVAAALFALGMKVANAQTAVYYGANGGQTAYNQCKSYEASAGGQYPVGGLYPSCTLVKLACVVGATLNGWVMTRRYWQNTADSGYTACNPGQYVYAFGFENTCASGTEPDPAGTGGCFNPNVECQAIKARTENPSDGLYIGPNDERATIGATAGSTQCLGGCNWAPKPGEPSVSVGSGATKVNWAQYAFTGTACPATTESPAPVASKVPVKPTAQVCIPPSGVSSGMCVRQDGKHCYAASTGRQICWNPGETGNKTDAAWMQKREPGTVTSPVAPLPPAGETLTQQGTPQTVSSSTTVNNTTTTTTTTTTNYSTTSGTDAGTSNQGSPASGTGGAVVAGSGTSPTNGTVSGGTCESNYSCTGVSAVDCAILQETTKTRCATEKNDLTRAMTSGEMSSLTGEGADGAANGTAAGIVTNTTSGAEGLDTAGFLGGARSCPTIPTMDILGQSFTIDTSAVCNWMTIGGYLVMLFGSIASLMVLKGA